MSSYTDVKNLIISNIKANGQREITGPILQDVLLNMLENSSEADAANKKYVDNKINDIPIAKGTGVYSIVQQNGGNTASNRYSSAFGYRTNAPGYAAHAEGHTTTASGQASHVEGESNTASGERSHAEGYASTASGQASHAEGTETKATNDSAHAEGYKTTAARYQSHAEGNQTYANGVCSHTEGFKTQTTNKGEHAEGLSNISIEGKTVHTVGIGSAEDNVENRKNAHEIHFDGKHYIYGIGGYDGTNSQTEGTKTVQEVITESANAVQITYAKLKSLRDAGNLVPGTQYRITDYTCTTMQEGTRSAGHQFDIIVTADDESTLNEVARAVKHEGDTYFANSDLNAWKIWYCLDNDTNRFTWAMMKGRYIGVNFGETVYARYAEAKVINDVTYELWSTLEPGFYIGTKTLEVDEYCDAISIDEGGNFIVAAENFAKISDIKEVEDGKGVIYRMIDEFDNDCPYDFKNIQFYRQWDEDKSSWSTISTDNTGVPCYTFSSEGDSSTVEFTDMSLIRDSQVYGNIIKAYAPGIQMLNNNCFFGAYYNLNTFGNDCDNNTFGNSCYNNTFGNGCWNNAFGNYCRYNTFGNDCYNNTFGNDCYNNTFGNSYRDNTFGNTCHDNTFGSDCFINTLGDYCAYNRFGNMLRNGRFGNNCNNNTFGNSCTETTFGNNCNNNTFGNSCTETTFGNNCNSNAFENDCNSNAFGNYCRYNTFGNSCISNTFGNNCSNNTFGNNCSDIKFASDSSASDKYNHYRNNHFGDGCLYIVFTGAETASSSQQVQNYNFAQGLRGTQDKYLTIDGVRGRSFETYISKDTDGAIKESIIAEKLDKVIEISYNDLVTLRGSSKLVSGQQYRIIDYTCTTTQSGTKSAGHQFDIIVTADDESTLNEVARAVKHDGDTYFVNSDLNAWKIWYSFDNDLTRFAWADSTNGKGVIYRMIDEWNNDVPYDFKNIQFYRKWDATKSLWSTISSDNTGVPCYTFSSKGDSATTLFTDTSLSAFNNIYSNVIGKYVNDNKQTLNNICFFGNSCRSNTFGNSCYSNTFGNSCYNNTFGNSCYSNTFGNSCYNNTFGNSCSSNSFGKRFDTNTFGNNCGSNTFGNGCDSNAFGNDCDSNTFGNDCDSNTFGNSYWYNTFGNSCYNNTFGDDCNRNTFGNDCDSNAFGNYCDSNTFGNSCDSNAFGDSCDSNAFGDSCSSNSFGKRFDANTFGNNCGSNTFGNYCSRNAFGNDCWYNTFGNDCSSNTFGNNCSSNTFGISFQANTFGNYCYCNTFGNDCSSNTFGTDCSRNTVGNDCEHIRFASDSSSAATKYNYYQHNHFGDGCAYLVFKGTETASNAQQVQNYNFVQGLQGTDGAYLTIDGVINRAYETKVAKNSNGELKIYCEADLIL